MSNAGRTLVIEGAVTAEELRRELIARCEVRGEAAKLAEHSGVPISLISEVRSGKRGVSPSIANAPGYVVPGFYVPARAKEPAQ